MSGQRVGVVGDTSLSRAVEAAGGEPVVGDATAIEDVAFVVAVGEETVVDLARGGVSVPVLAVDAGAGLRSVSRANAGDAIDRIVDSEYPTERHPVVAAEGTDISARALFDVMLVAAEPARISEFAVRNDGESVDRFRADGVVASTPAGSVGYNDAAGGPVAAPETGVVSVVPLAPFATDADHWVLPLDGVAMSVERDETPVELLADGRSAGVVEAGDPIELSHAGDLRTLVVPEGERFY